MLLLCHLLLLFFAGVVSLLSRTLDPTMLWRYTRCVTDAMTVNLS